jgi:hypothetical protein
VKAGKQLPMKKAPAAKARLPKATPAVKTPHYSRPPGLKPNDARRRHRHRARGPADLKSCGTTSGRGHCRT